MGKDKSFDQVARLHWSSIFRFVLSSVRAHDLAEDLTQDCFYRAFKAWNAFRHDCSVHTWLRRIAANVIKNFFRQEDVQIRRIAPPIDQFAEDYWLSDQGPCPETTTIRRDSLRTIWQAAEEVSPRQQTALRLRFTEDMDVAEIATAMGTTEGSVKVHLFRAVHSIRATLHLENA